MENRKVKIVEPNKGKHIAVSGDINTIVATKDMFSQIQRKKYLSHLISYMWFTDGFGKFQELFEYNHQVRKNYLLSFQKIISWEDMIKNRETAWLSMKDTLLHIMWVEDTWINYSIQGLDDPNRPFPYHKSQTQNALIDQNQEVTSRTKKYLSNIQKEDLLNPTLIP